MKIALMQPYFFPYLGYYQLIQSVDEFVIFDQAQFIRRGWIARNRILNAHKETVYIHVPVCKAPRETRIKDIRINHDMNWQEKMIQQLLYYKDAPNFMDVMKFVKGSLSVKFDHISELNTFLLRETCKLFNIQTKITVLSEKFPEIIESNEADEWGIQVSHALHATTYINAFGGKEFYSQQKYADHNLDIQFINQKLESYKQFNHPFVPGLSIIDVMMFNDIDTIKQMINVHELIK